MKSNHPCMGLCTTSLGDEICKGCHRTSQEVIEWNGYTQEQKDVVLDRIKLTNEDLKVSEQRVFTDKELLDGWAFRSYEKEGQEYCARRYKEIKESGAEIKLNKRPCYGRCEYTGELLNDAAKALSRSDIAIWADQGNLCFGGHLIRSGDKFSGSYNTD